MSMTLKPWKEQRMKDGLGTKPASLPKPTTAPTTDPYQMYLNTTANAEKRSGQRISALNQEEAAERQKLEQQRSLQRQQAEINYELVKKYLPIANKASGMHGLGVSESAALGANASYQNRLGSIERDYADRSADFLKYYTDARMKEEDALADKKDAALKYYLERKDVEDAKAEADQARLEDKQALAYEDALSMIESGAFDTPEEIYAYLNRTNPYLSEKGKTDIDAYVNAYIRDNNLKSETASGGTDESAPSGEGLQRAGVKVDDNVDKRALDEGTEVRVYFPEGGFALLKTVGSVSASDFEKQYPEVKDIPPGEIFLYNGDMYMKKSGNVYQFDPSDFHRGNVATKYFGADDAGRKKFSNDLRLWNTTDKYLSLDDKRGGSGWNVLRYVLGTPALTMMPLTAGVSAAGFLGATAIQGALDEGTRNEVGNQLGYLYDNSIGKASDLGRETAEDIINKYLKK